MKKTSLLISTIFIFIGCSGKELKHYGGELALSNGGNPIMIGTTIAIGGTLYGIGSLIDNNKNNLNKKDENENK